MRIAHFRPVIERDDGSVVGIEVKAAASVGTGDFKGLRQLAAACGPALRIGLVLYDGNAAVRFGERLWAVPVACVLG